MPRILVVVIMTALAVMSYSGSAQAKEEKPIVQAETLISGGGPLFLGTMEDANSHTTQVFTMRFGQTVRFPRWMPLGLEATVMVPTQAGISLLADLLIIKDFRWSINAGILSANRNPMSVSRVERKWDLTAGTEFSYRIHEKVRITLDWRTFLPNPSEVWTNYATFSEPIFEEALKGGQIWLGIAIIW